MAFEKVDGHKIISGYEIGSDLCQALGIDPDLVTDITIHCPVNDIVTVTIKRLVKQQNLVEFISKFETYPLTKANHNGSN